MNDQVKKIHISKIDAAKRQLETAITLYFRSGDPVSIHTLTAAGYDILHGLSKTRGIKPFVKNTDMIRDEKKKKYLDMVNEAQNFFKHADRDTDKLYEFRPATTEFLIWDACQMYQQITTEIPKLMYIFNFWFFINNPGLAKDQDTEKKLTQIGTSFSINNRTDFFKEASDAYELTKF